MIEDDGEELVAVEFSDRYSALGIVRPRPETVCLGQCEGMGCVPIHASRTDEPWHTLWLEAEQRHGASEDGYHFVRCPACEGSGLRKETLS